MQSNILQSGMLLNNHKVNFLWHVTICINLKQKINNLFRNVFFPFIKNSYFEFVYSRQQYPPKFSVFRSLESDVSGFYLDGRFFNRVAVFVHHETVDASVRLC